LRDTVFIIPQLSVEINAAAEKSSFADACRALRSVIIDPVYTAKFN
jgi:hypothetical protein